MSTFQRLLPPLLAVTAGVGITYYTFAPGLKELNLPPALPPQGEQKPEESLFSQPPPDGITQDRPRPSEPPVQQIAGGFEHTPKPQDTFADEPSSIGGTGKGNPEKKRARWW
ncbi:hypothetical protein IAT38_000593 [Cryptococcus sp. DSM 104549]